MNRGSLLLGVILTLIIVFPLIMLQLKKQKQKKKMLHALATLVAQKNATLADPVFCSDFVMGLDPEKKVLGFYRNSHEGEESLLVDLKEYKQCNADIRREATGNSGLNGSAVSRIDLVFTPRDGSKKDLRLELYDSNKSFQLSGELLLAEEWCQKLKSFFKG